MAKKPAIRIDRRCYSALIADRLCERLAAGEGLDAICADDGMPPAHIVDGWVLYPDEEERPGFVEQFIRAGRIGLNKMAREIITISDDDGEDYKERCLPTGRRVVEVDNQNIHRARLRVDSRKWMLEKLLPKIYGQAIKVEHEGSIDLVGRLAAARQRVDLAHTLQETTDRILIESRAQAIVEPDIEEKA